MRAIDGPKNVEQSSLVHAIIPFSLSYMSSFIVAYTLRYTDQRSLLFLLTLLVFAGVALVDNITGRFGLYVARFIIYMVLFLLANMLSMYVIQFMTLSLDDTPAPNWVEIIAYVHILVLILLMAISQYASEISLTIKTAFETAFSRLTRQQQQQQKEQEREALKEEDD